MDVAVFESARSLLGEIYGALSEVANGNSVRCSKAHKGKVTLYRPSSGVSPGNRGEIAFDIPSHAARAGVSEGEAAHFFQVLKAATGRATERNLRYDWPRVGFSTLEEAQFIALRLRQFFNLPAT